MTLEQISEDVRKEAEAKVSEIEASAKAESKKLIDEAKKQADEIRLNAETKAQREAEQIAREVVASARQSNQKEVLIAKRAALDAAFDMAKASISDVKMKGRESLLKSLIAEAKKVGGKGFILHPAEVDKASLSKLSGDFEVGETIQCMGGFILSSNDGSVSFDMRFDTLLERAWSDNLASINNILFE